MRTDVLKRKLEGHMCRFHYSLDIVSSRLQCLACNLRGGSYCVTSMQPGWDERASDMEYRSSTEFRICLARSSAGVSSTVGSEAVT